MFAYFRRQRLIVPIAPSAGGAAGLCFALAAALMPGGMLDALVAATHLPAVVAAAEPPLGVTARALLVLLGGAGVALVTGFALYAVVGLRAIAVGASLPVRDGDMPVLRRADAHPDAPARALLLAGRDLGDPVEEAPAPSPVEADLPCDLDRPLSQFDPGAIPDSPRAPSRALPPLARIERPQTFEPAERFETFDPAGLMVEDAIERPAARPDKPDASATLHALLDRLERGVARRASPVLPPRMPLAPPPDALHDALGTLRRLAGHA